MHWTSPDEREQQGLLSRPPEAPAASAGVGWTPIAKVVRASFLGVERTTSLEAESHDVAQGYRHVMRQRLKPWCGLGGQRRVPDRRKWPDREQDGRVPLPRLAEYLSHCKKMILLLGPRD